MSDTVIQAAPWVELAKPFVDVLAPIAVTAAVGWGIKLFQQATNIKVDQATRDKINAAAQLQAGLLLAKSETNLSGVSIDAHNPDVAAASVWVANTLRDDMKAAGVSQDDIAHAIAAKIGELQAQSPAAAPLPSPGH